MGAYRGPDRGSFRYPECRGGSNHPTASRYHSGTQVWLSSDCACRNRDANFINVQETVKGNAFQQVLSLPVVAQAPHTQSTCPQLVNHTQVKQTRLNKKTG